MSWSLRMSPGDSDGRPETACAPSNVSRRPTTRDGVVLGHPRTDDRLAASKGAHVVTDTKARPRQKQAGLSPEQLSEVLGLLKGADSVELKLSVPDADRRSTVAALAMDPLDAQIRQVVF